MYRLVLPRALFTQLALLEEGAEGLLLCEESARLRFVVKSFTRGTDWHKNGHIISQKGNAIFGSYRVVPYIEGSIARKDLAATLASHVLCSWVWSQVRALNLPQSPVQFSLVFMKRVRHHIYSTVVAGHVLHSVPRNITDDAATILRRVSEHVTHVNDELIDLNAEIDDVAKPDAALPDIAVPNPEVTELLLELEARLRPHVVECRLVNDTGLSLHESLERHVDDINFSDEDLSLIGEFPDLTKDGNHVLVNPYDTVRNNTAPLLCEEDAEIERLKTAIDTIEEENELLLKEYREIYKHVMFLRVADKVLLPNTEVDQQQNQIKAQPHEEFASHHSPPRDEHVSHEEFDAQDMDEDMRRAIELSKFEQ